jgi:cation:H+ antiporter
MIFAVVILWLMALDGAVSRLDGLLLLVGAISYTVWSIVESRRETKQAQQKLTPEISGGPKSLPGQIGFILVGLAMLGLGSNWLVDGAVAVAAWFGVSEMVIGLTLVAAGTSLPELATSVLASLRGERDIAVGNVVGSNIFNILAVLGLAAVVSPVPLAVPSTTQTFDLPIVFIVSLLCLPIFFTGGQIARWEGVLFLSYYGLYTGYLLLAADGSPWTSDYSAAITWIILPLTALVLLVSVGRAVRNGQTGAA